MMPAERLARGEGARGNVRGPIGDGRRRVEDASLLRGEAVYAADLAPEGVVDVAFARSWAAHGRLRNVDVSAARTAPGVTIAWAAADAPFPPTPPTPPNADSSLHLRPTLARDKVRYVGEPVAVVVAEDRYVAEDAVDQIDIDIDPLPAVLDPTAAAAPDAPQIFDGISNVVVRGQSGSGVGDVLSTAPVVVETSFKHPRLAHMAIEGRAIVAIPTSDRRLEITVSHQAPHRLRSGLALALGLDEERIRVKVPLVGGAFGGKSQTYPEYIAVCYLALELGRPLRWVEDRSENLIAASHGRAQNQRVRLAADETGSILALDMELDADIGAYPHTGSFLPGGTATMMSGPYAIPHIEVHFKGVITNTPPTTAYRGAGRPEATFALEVTIERLAAKLGLDPVDIRKRNFIDSFPFETDTGELYDSGDYGAALDLAVERADGDPSAGRPFVGAGAASYLERSGGRSDTFEFGQVTVMPEGRVIAHSGSMSTGQGHRTAFAQIVASLLGLDPELIEVRQGDTDQVERGYGTFASRSVQLGGVALFVSASNLLEVAKDAAADILEVSVDDLSYSGGIFSIAGAPVKSVSLFDVAARLPLEASESFSSSFTYPFGSYVAEVAVDPETGAVTPIRIVAVDDCGTIINPLLVEGQIHGAIAQGVGAALLEGMVYDDDGQPLTASMMDYLAPSAMDVPDMDVYAMETPTPRNPLGAKGVGEAGCIGAPPAVVNAVFEVLRRKGVVSNEVTLPLRPEDVWRLLNRRSS